MLSHSPWNEATQGFKTKLVNDNHQLCFCAIFLQFTAAVSNIERETIVPFYNKNCLS